MGYEQKDIMCIAFISFLFGCLLTGTVLFNIAQRRIDEADRTAERLTEDLGRTSEQLINAELIIGECRTGLAGLSEQLNAGTGRLGDIICSLEAVRDEVKKMEELLYNYNSGVSNIH